MCSSDLNARAVKEKDYENVFADTWEQGWRVTLFGDTQESEIGRASCRERV